MPAAAPSRSPQRRCIACRRESSREALLRLVLAPDGAPVADLQGRLPGRGAHCCRRRRCLQAAVRSGPLSRAFRTRVGTVDTASWLLRLHAQVERSLLELLGVYAKGGVAISGAERLRATLATTPTPSGMLLLAHDAGATARGRWVGRGERHGLTVHEGLDRDRMGKALGTPQCSVVWLRSPGAARRVEWLLELLEESSARTGTE